MGYANYESMFLGNKDVKIFYSVNKVEDAKACVVFVHGICEHLGRYEYLTEKFNNEGYNVYRYDARGHGKSEGARGSLDSFDDYLSDLDVLVTLAKKDDKDLKLVLLGHSMGGLVATAYTCKYPNKVDLLVLSGACNVCPSVASALKYLPYNLMGKLKYTNKLGDGVCSVKEVVDAYNKDPLVLKKVSFKLLGNAFIKGTKYVKKNIENIKCPTLVLHGEKDGIVVKSTGEWTYNNLVCNDKILKIYPGLYHEIFNEYNKDEVIKDTLDWLKERVG